MGARPRVPPCPTALCHLRGTLRARGRAGLGARLCPALALGRELCWHLHQHRPGLSAQLRSAGSVRGTRGAAGCGVEHLGGCWQRCGALGRECQQCGALGGAAKSSVEPQQPPHRLAAVAVPRWNTLHPARRCRLRCLHSMTHRTWPVPPLRSGRLRPRPRGLTSTLPALDTEPRPGWGSQP